MIKKLQEWLSWLSWGDRSMPMMSKKILISCVVLAWLVISAAPAYAYLDPGTGSMIVQSIAAIVLTAGAMAGVFWKAIKNFFLNIGKPRKNGAAENDQPAGSNKIEGTDVKHDSDEG